LGGNRGTTSAQWFTTLKAGVTFTTDGKSTGDYGTISIPRQGLLGGANGTTAYRFIHGTNLANPPTCDTNPVELTIKFVAGKPGVSQTGVNYSIVSGGVATTGCGGISYFNGSRGNQPDDVVTWTKQ
jgi:hypothetical protein